MRKCMLEGILSVPVGGVVSFADIRTRTAMGGRKHLGREKLVTQLRKLAKGKGIALAKPNASRGKVILPLVLHLSHTIVNLRCSRLAPAT